MAEKKFVSIFPYNVKAYLQNVLVDPKRNKGIERSIFSYLRKYLSDRNIEINTYDIKTSKSPFKYIYFDLPYPWDFKAWKILLSHINKSILICNEPPIVIPFNYWKIFHIFFRNIFTWYDPLVDNKKYYKILLPKSSDGINTIPKNYKDKKFLVLINKNIAPFLPFEALSPFGKELYTERIKAIEFFEKNIPDKFYLYGRGWNKPKKYNLKEEIFGFKKYSTYKGEIDNKIELLSNFKYSICFENLTDTKGFITEKIFDCLKARCVPIYLGATDINRYIPKECFIDFRRFNDYQKLLDFLGLIDEKTYNRYIENINKLLSDKKFIDTWFEEGFAKFFTKNILEIKN